MEKKSKAWLIGLPVATLTAFVVAGFMILNQNTVSSEMKGFYNFASVEQLNEQLSNPDSDFLKNNIVCVNGTVYQFGESGVWESTGVAAEGSYIKNGVDGKDGVSSYAKMKELGFTGTEEDYNNILSNIGEYADEETSIYEKACILGFEGTPEDFINCFYIEGENGLDGKDGRNGINGKNGKNGKNGANGKDGKNGKNGSDGKDGKDGCQIDIRGIYFFRDGQRDLIATGINAEETFSEDGEIQWGGKEREEIVLSVENNSLKKTLDTTGTEEVAEISDFTGDIWQPVVLTENEGFINYATDNGLDESNILGYVKSTRVEKFKNITTTAEFEEMLLLDEVMIVNTNYTKDYSTPLNDNKRNFNLNGFTVVENLNPSTIYKDGNVMDYDFNNNIYNISTLNLKGETNTNNAYEVGTILNIKPNDESANGWILIEQGTIDVSGTYPVSYREYRTHIEYEWEYPTDWCTASQHTAGDRILFQNVDNVWSATQPATLTQECGARAQWNESWGGYESCAYRFSSVPQKTGESKTVVDSYLYYITLPDGSEVEVAKDVESYDQATYEYTGTTDTGKLSDTATDFQIQNIIDKGIDPDNLSYDNVGKYIYCGLIPAS